jgi:2'-5' RNA ligase
MGSLVIVALPAEDELVNKISSEKVPHLTLMYLGEETEEQNVLRMAEFVDHALTVNQHGPFYLDVDYRGELGADKADVVFFNGGWEAKWIKSLRGQLLKQNDIRTAFEKADQFPDWVPHLTLGYPDTPAKELPAEYTKLYGVQFDRIAIWTGDYEGPEFRLKWPDREDLEDPAIAWDGLSEEGKEFVIAHYGTKGMKWGVRKEELAGGGHIRINERNNRATISNSSVALYVAGVGVGAFLSPRFRREWSAANTHNQAVIKEEKLAKKDMKWEKQIYTVPGAVKVHNEMASHFNQRIEAINSKPAYKNINLNTHPDSKAAKAYLKEVNDLTMEGNRLAVQKVHGSSPSGKKVAQLRKDGSGIEIVDAAKIKHAAEEDEVISFVLRWDDETGKTLEMNTAEEASASHEIDRGREFIEHHGVKGMRWGVHRDDVERAASSSPSKLGAAVREASKFARDVEFEANTRPRKSEVHEDLETDSVAKEKVVEGAEKNFRKRDLPGIKSKPEYARASKLRNRLLHPTDAMTKAYRKEVRETYIRRLESTANEMKNASGTREYTIREKGGDLPTSKYYWEVSTREAKHADGKDEPLLLEVLMDDAGFITGTKPVTAEIKQAMDLGDHILEHYGVKGMHWGERKEHARTGRKGETKKSMFDPEGHDLGLDIAKSVLLPMVPPLGLFAIPANVRLVRVSARAAGAKVADMDEKRFAARAHSEKNFVKIHNGAQTTINKGIADLNKKYPGDLTKNPTAKKRYDADVTKMMQDAYRQSANAIGNKTSMRQHLDVTFKNDGRDFNITAKEGRPTPIAKRLQEVKHAADDEIEFEVTLEFSGKVEREPTGSISGFKFKGIEQKDPDSAAHSMSTADLGQEFLEHYGVKGMQWGVRRMSERSTPLPVAATARTIVPPGAKRKTKIKVSGGENHDATEDAIAVAQAAAKLKKSGPHALTNKELQQIASRIELEDRVTRATRSKGNKFVRELIEGETKSIAKEGFRTATGRQGGGKKKQ